MTGRPRCTTRSCPVRYRGGPDRACPLHQQDELTLTDRWRAWQNAQAEAPGERDQDAGEGWTQFGRNFRQ